MCLSLKYQERKEHNMIRASGAKEVTSVLELQYEEGG